MPGIPEIESYQMPTPSCFPSNLVNWKVDFKRAVLLIHDMQRFFVKKIPKNGARSALLYNIAMLREHCKVLDVPIAYTCQTGNMSESQRGLLKDFWGKGMKAEPSDKQIVDELLPNSEDWIFTKWRYSAFFNSNLLQEMRKNGRDQLIVCGVYAHIGVLLTAVEAFSNDIETFLIADGVADFSQEAHFMALNYAAKCCAAVISTEVLLEQSL